MTIYWSKICFVSLFHSLQLSSQSYFSSTSSQYPLLICCHSFSPPPTISSLKITDRSFRYALPRLWNQLPDSFRQPHHSRLDSPPHPLFNSSLSSSTLSSSITPSLFHSFTPGSKPTFSTNPFHRRFLLLSGLPHDNGTGPDLSRSSLYF